MRSTMTTAIVAAALMLLSPTFAFAPVHNQQRPRLHSSVAPAPPPPPLYEQTPLKDVTVVTTPNMPEMTNSDLSDNVENFIKEASSVENNNNSNLDSLDNKNEISIAANDTSELSSILSSTAMADFADKVSHVLEVSEQKILDAEEKNAQQLATKQSVDNNDDNAVTTTTTTPVILDEDSDLVINKKITTTSVVTDDPNQVDDGLTTLEREAADLAEITPSVKKILQFAVPAIGVWLCGPLLSLIDTSAVGLLSGTAQQAALNPAVAVTDYAALLVAFLYTGTTNLMAACRESDRNVKGSPKTTKTLVGALQLSTLVGAGLGLVLFAFAKPLLRAIIGNDAISPDVMTAAMKYVRIRALGMPAAAVIGSAQAASLGLQDVKSPLYVLAAAALVNFCGDVLFVGRSHAWIGGAAGAAWATVISQYAALFIFMHWLTHRAKKNDNSNNNDKKNIVNVSEAVLELTGKPIGKGRRAQFKVALKKKTNGLFSSSNNNNNNKAVVEPIKEEAFTVRGFLQDKFKLRDLLRLPSKDVVNEFKPYIAPVTSTQVGRVSGYVAMSHVVSSSLGTVSMAAQQVLVSLFYCLCPIADSLSLTAQSFVPAIAEKRRSVARALALRTTGNNLAKAGTVFGAIMVAAVASIPVLSPMFTTDPNVINLVNKVAPLLVGFFGVHGLVCALEGQLLGQKDLAFLGRMYAGFFLVVPYFMLKVKTAALAGKAVSLTHVWSVFVTYQLVRAATWGVRVAFLRRRTNKHLQQEGLQQV